MPPPQATALVSGPKFGYMCMHTNSLSVNVQVKRKFELNTLKTGQLWCHGSHIGCFYRNWSKIKSLRTSTCSYKESSCFSWISIYLVQIINPISFYNTFNLKIYWIVYLADSPFLTVWRLVCRTVCCSMRRRHSLSTPHPRTRIAPTEAWKSCQQN